MTSFDLTSLNSIIKTRIQSDSEDSYTRQLFDKGITHCSQKMGEEAIELVIATIQENREDICKESADLLYHFLVLLKASDVDLHDVYMELQSRTNQSGLQEKASRSQE